jgi:hypothetical protein
MTKGPSPAGSGARAGAVLGAVCRPVVVGAFWLLGDPPAPMWLVIVAISTLIGLGLGAFAGWVAGSIRHPLAGPVAGAALGATLAFGSSVVTALLLCVATAIPAQHERDVNLALYWPLMAFAGALPGVGGGLAGQRVRQHQGPGPRE